MNGAVAPPTPNCTDLLYQGIDGSGIPIGTILNLTFDYIQNQNLNFTIQLFGMQSGDQIDRAQLRCENAATNTAACTPLLGAAPTANGVALTRPTDWPNFSILSMATTQTFAAFAVVFRAANTCTGPGIPPVGCGLSGVDSVSLITKASADIPEPSTLAILCFGLAGLGFARGKRAA